MCKLPFSDPDGDYVAFSTDEELCDALGFVTDGVFKVYVRLNGKHIARDNAFFFI